MAQYDLTNNDGTPFRTEREKQSATQTHRSEADMFIEKTLKGEVSDSTVAIALAVVVAIVSIVSVISWAAKRPK